MSEPLVVVGLLSGGKDSCYNLCHCVKQGHRIAALATLAPPQGKDEIDSYMYQTVGHDAVHLVADAMEIPLYRGVILGQAINKTSTYGDRLPSSSIHTIDDKDETEDLYRLLSQVKETHPDVNAISVGAILSNYQRIRVEHVALRAGLQLLPLSYLWQRDQKELLDEMCQAGMESILIKVAGAGLEENHLGMTLLEMRSNLHRLNRIYGAHICGEGGEYETLTLDCPLFKKKIVIDKSTIVVHSDSSFASVFYLRIDKAHLVEKRNNSKTLQDVALPPILDRLSLSSLARAQTSDTSISPSRMMKIERLKSPEISASVFRKGHWFAFGGFNGQACKTLLEEFASAFASLQNELECQSLSLAHLSHLNIFLSSQDHFTTLNKVYSTYFGVDPPSRACVAVNMAPESGCHLIVDAIAFDDGSRYLHNGMAIKGSNRSTSRKVLHVQSRSFWAAANIGPYSQSVNVGGRISIAGQIGLLPTTLQLADSVPMQITLSLQNARRVFKATLEARFEKQKGWIEGCICWIDDEQWIRAAQKVWQEQYEKEEEDWESAWLGASFADGDLPISYVLLPKGALPKSANVEWQLFAHDGKAVSKEADEIKEECEDGEASSPTVIKEEDIYFAGFSGTHSAILSKEGGSSFGIVHLDQRSSSSIVTSWPSLNLLSSALSIKILYRCKEDLNLVQREISGWSAAKTFLPILECFNDHLQSSRVVLIWQDV